MSSEIKDSPALAPISAEDCPEFIRVAMANAGWTTLSEVQAVGIPYMLRHIDVMVQAKTGSGKTGAFILPLTETLDPLEDNCQALILVPTRELALQVVEEANTAGLKADAAANRSGRSAKGPTLSWEPPVA